MLTKHSPNQAFSLTFITVFKVREVRIILNRNTEMMMIMMMALMIIKIARTWLHENLLNATAANMKKLMRKLKLHETD